jgi:hypothetical protein
MRLHWLYLFVVALLLSGCVTTSVTLEEKEFQSGNDSTVVNSVQSCSKCSVEEVDNAVIVRVIIDARAENLPFELARHRKKIEGTAMLRTFEGLKKAYPGLANTRLSSRRLRNSFDDDTCCYYYDSSFKKSDILKRIKQPSRR